MKIQCRVYITACCCMLVFTQPMFGEKNARYVDVFIGTGGHGHVFPGACLPFGMVQLSPDQKTTGWDFCSGYHYSQDTILGFSHTHLNGTGIGDLGDILITPSTKLIYGNPLKHSKAYAGTFNHSNERAQPGYYQVFLNNCNVQAELTCTEKVGIHRYTKRINQDTLGVLIDLGHKIYSNWGTVIEHELEVVDPYTIKGYKIGTGWAPLRKLYFTIHFSQPMKTWIIGNQNYSLQGNLTRQRGTGAKLFVRFDATVEVLEARVGLSVNSIENAFKNLLQVQNKGFDDVVTENTAIWNAYLDKIEIVAPDSIRKIFYTGLYHTLVQPNNIADPDSSYWGPDYRTHKSKSGAYYSTFSLWDTYRATHPLYTLLVPGKVSEMVQNFIEHYIYNGYLPKWTLMGTENHCMIGVHSVPVIADAILKSISGFSYHDAYQAMKMSLIKDHENHHFNAHGYATKGYFANDLIGESVSKTLEIAFNDWCVAQVASVLGQNADAAYFEKRSLNFKNVYQANKKLMMPRNGDGQWVPYSPYKVQYGSAFTEGNAWQYTWSVQHKPIELIQLMGGPKAALQMLDQTFSDATPMEGHVSDVSGLIGQYAHGNEPSHHIAYFYQYLHRPEKTQFLVRKIMTELYNTHPEGLCGNEDCGQMSAWYIFSALGFYPFNPGSATYVLGAPLVTSAVVYLDNGKKLEIVAKNQSSFNKYVRKVFWNGTLKSDFSITHAEILKGGKLEFEMYNGK